MLGIFAYASIASFQKASENVKKDARKEPPPPPPYGSQIQSGLSFKYFINHVFFLLSLAPQPNLGLGLLHKIRLNFLEAS
jgi:hypothetical protein